MTNSSQIQFIKHSQINIEKWDNCIANSYNELVYAYSWYLNIVSPNWNAIVVNDYEVVMPLTHRNKWGVNYLYQPIFTQQLGLFASSKSQIDFYLKDVLLQIQKHYKFIDIQLNANNTSSNFNTRNNFELDLNQSYESIVKNFSNGIKDNIRKAKNTHYQSIKTKNYNYLIDFFIQEKGAEFENISPDNYKTLKQICAELENRNSLHCKTIYSKNQSIIASGIFIHTAKRIIFINGTNSLEGRKNGALSYLLAQHIEEHCNKNLIFDFEGSVSESLAKFYSGFGSKNIPYPKLKINNLPLPIRWLKK